MARRKSTEVLITGDKVDPRARAGITTPPGGAPSKQPAGAFAEEHLARRPRKKPMVIDVAGKASANNDAQSELAALERELGMAPTAATGEALNPTLEPPDGARRGKEDPNWQAIQRAKKPEYDLPPQTEPAAKKESPDAFDPSQQAAPKPVADMAPPSAPARPPASAEGRKPELAQPQRQNRQMAETVVASILDRIKEEALNNGGQLGVHHIDALRTEFESQTQALTQAFEKSFEAYVLARERAAWNNKRDYPFDRLIVKKFSHLFADKKAGFDRVSRRMLPGFFMAQGMMLGPDMVDEMQERCRLIVERIRAEKQQDFDWSDVYQSVEKDDVVMDGLVPMALQFEDFERRRDWFINLINGHLSPLAAHDKEDAGWELTVPGFTHLFGALFGDLRKDLASETKKPRIVKRYGADAVKTLRRVLDQFG